jgi:hypothetical protein
MSKSIGHAILVQICRVFKVIQEIYYEQTIFFRQIIQVSGLFKNKLTSFVCSMCIQQKEVCQNLRSF